MTHCTLAPPSRVLIYSHDSFGLGHLRRCRAIAAALVERFPDLSVLLLSGSPIIGGFEYPERVDFVRVPGIIKLRDGEYSAHRLPLDVAEVLELRRSIIRHTAIAYAPDLVIVDKEPLGLRGELADTLAELAARGARLVLGVRDILDDPAALAREWARKRVYPALRELYDEIWVYGRPEVYDPFAGLPLAPSVVEKVVYTGYLRRASAAARGRRDTPYLLVTPGGGADGSDLIERVLRAYERETMPMPALVLLGPFMPAQAREAFAARVEGREDVRVLTFHPRPEELMAGAAGVVAMGGYNTFCEILSFDKPALLAPRREPRREQLIRASRARELGLADVLPPAGAGDGAGGDAALAQALRALPARPPPSRHAPRGWLGGLESIEGRVLALMRCPTATGGRARARAPA